MEFRIGINLGDVIVEGERIYGDGVNIAARLESLADPGGICVSGTVYDHIENKLPLQYEYLGEQTVKNIAKPVRVWRVAGERQGGRFKVQSLVGCAIRSSWYSQGYCSSREQSWRSGISRIRHSVLSLQHTSLRKRLHSPCPTNPPSSGCPSSTCAKTLTKSISATASLKP